VSLTLPTNRLAVRSGAHVTKYDLRVGVEPRWPSGGEHRMHWLLHSTAGQSVEQAMGAIVFVCMARLTGPTRGTEGMSICV